MILVFKQECFIYLKNFIILIFKYQILHCRNELLVLLGVGGRVELERYDGEGVGR